MAVILLVCGLITGVLGGALGIGGGAIMVPVLMSIGYPWEYACGISLLCILLSSLVVSYGALTRGEVDLRECISIEAWGCALSYAGYLLMSHLAGWGLKKILGCLLIALTLHSALSVLSRSRRARHRALDSSRSSLSADDHIPHTLNLGPTTAFQKLLLSPLVSHVVYSITGLCSGMFGLGGGVILVPWLHYVRGYPWTRASATSSYAMSGLTAGALVGYLTTDHMPWSSCLVASVGVVLGSLGGAYAKRRVSARVLQITLTLLMAGIAVMVWWKILLPKAPAS